MGHEVRHHKLKPLHHKQRRLGSRSDEIGPPPLGYPPTQAAIPYYNTMTMTPSTYVAGPPALVSPQQEQQFQQALADVKRHSRNERIGEVGAAAAGAFALYELHEAKVDPEHARRHKLEAKLAGAVAVGSANYAYHEHKEKKKSEHLVEVLSGGGRNSTSNTNQKKNPLLTIASGHKHDSNKKKDLISNGDKHDGKKEKQNLLQILNGDSRHDPSKHQQTQKQKHHHLHLW
ncbi:hypothetical protein GOP47_0016261 [Adiantum capillus-veneris]|uniref:Uncharacterized protein n=1 Tax=Adiantum capillus-veneris TaxID=13818 RepID=A0A9D4ZCT0_ADICA|nr:hypothetical protein GOP47_0016261 [Adiantum capillus-veneris]